MKISPTELRRSFEGGGEKVSKNFTISRNVWNRIAALVPTGHGQYGSTLLDRATRLVLFILAPQNQELEENQIYSMLQCVLQDNDSGDLFDAAERIHYIGHCLRRMSKAQYWLSDEDVPWEGQP